jgi:glycerol-3-phosphate dehydrogenase
VGASGFRKGVDGVSIVELEDTIDVRSFELRARLVVNAAGVWTDEVSRLFDSSAPKRLRPSKGIHVVVPTERLQNRTAVLIPSLGENRFLFVIPWQGRTVIGTTDTDYTGSLDDPRAEAEEVDRVVQSAARAFPEARLSTGDVISTFAGLRPLIAADGHSTKDLSRREEIFEDKAGMITITGGKLTTWRKMAERVTDIVGRRLEAIDGVSRRQAHRCATEHIPLMGGPPHSDARQEAQRAAAEFSVGIATVEHLMATYGGNYRVILEITRGSEELHTTLMEGLPHIGAEAVYAARYEMAVTVEDFLSRRTRLDLLARDHGHSCAMRVATLLGRESV